MHLWFNVKATENEIPVIIVFKVTVQGMLLTASPKIFFGE